MKKMICALFTLAFAAHSLVAATVSDVTVRQQWPWSKNVVINYTLTTDVPVDVDVKVTRNNVTTVLPPSALSGATCSLSSGAYKICWDPTATFPTEEIVPNVTIDVVPVTERTYMIVDLSDGLANTEAARITYTNEVVGARTASNEDASWRLWDDYYKTNAIVFRRCLPGTFMMGSRPDEWNRPTDFSSENYHQVTLTRPFYIGVFEVTQEQYRRVFGSRPAKTYFTARCEMRPQESVNWNEWRGNTTWPSDDRTEAHSVTATTFFGKLRALTGGTLPFDFPEDAQWEYACRAGTTTSYYNGKDMTGPWDATTDDNLTPLARYGGNSSIDWGGAATTDPEDGGTAIVGSYQPNAWGLFDTLGNVSEYCLDRYAATGTDPETDPVGPAEGSMRVVRGARWCDKPRNTTGRPAAGARSFGYTSGSDIGKGGGARAAVTIY